MPMDIVSSGPQPPKKDRTVTIVHNGNTESQCKIVKEMFNKLKTIDTFQGGKYNRFWNNGNTSCAMNAEFLAE